MKIQVKRVYEPVSREDGRRFLVERLWPRGIKKEALGAEWLKDVAPSAELRTWFAHQVERWQQFCERYRTELIQNASVWQPLAEAVRSGDVTLLYSAHDTEHNGALVLRDFLTEQATQNRKPIRQSKGAARKNAKRKTTKRAERKTASRSNPKPVKRKTAKRAAPKR